MQIILACGHVCGGICLINDCAKVVLGCTRKLLPAGQQAAFLHGFCIINFLLEFCPRFPQRWTVTRKWKLKNPFPSLSCFRAVFYSSNKRGNQDSSLTLAAGHHQRSRVTHSSKEGRGFRLRSLNHTLSMLRPNLVPRLFCLTCSVRSLLFWLLASLNELPMLQYWKITLKKSEFQGSPQRKQKFCQCWV